MRDEHQRLGGSNVTVRKAITSLRLISDVEWSEFFESVSLVDATLRMGSDLAQMDFATRNLYRSRIEELSRGSRLKRVLAGSCCCWRSSASLRPWIWQSPW